jgi:hypothetical protein
VTISYRYLSIRDDSGLCACKKIANEACFYRYVHEQWWNAWIGQRQWQQFSTHSRTHQCGYGITDVVAFLQEEMTRYRQQQFIPIPRAMLATKTQEQQPWKLTMTLRLATARTSVTTWLSNAKEFRSCDGTDRVCNCTRCMRYALVDMVVGTPGVARSWGSLTFNPNQASLRPTRATVNHCAPNWRDPQDLLVFCCRLRRAIYARLISSYWEHARETCGRGHKVCA